MGKTRLVYDLPSSLMNHIGNTELDTAARNLDAKLARLAIQVTANDRAPAALALESALLSSWL
jgi:hypothetical protein